MATKTPVLMSPNNPDGWKLEELAERLIEEVLGKIKKIQDDPRPVARLVVKNNCSIICYLRAIVDFQTESMTALEQIGPNQGPLGKPRIGIGSNPPGDPS